MLLIFPPPPPVPPVSVLNFQKGSLPVPVVQEMPGGEFSMHRKYENERAPVRCVWPPTRPGMIFILVRSFGGVG